MKTEELQRVLNCDTQTAEMFWDYHNERPQIWKAFEKKALELWTKGFRHYGAKGIMEVVRYETNMKTGPKDQFKIGNNYTAYYSRIFLHKYPEKKDFFELRESRGLHAA